jgi:hypothetical protein
MPSLPKTSTLSPSEHVEYRATASGGMLVNMLTGICFELNRVGADVWVSLTAGATVERTIETLTARYGVAPDAVAADVNDFCDRMLAAGLVGQPKAG